MAISVLAEQALLQKLRTGQKGAVREWFQCFSPYLLNIALKQVPAQEDAEEIVQETFINCLRQLPLFQGKARLRTWMVSILKHEIADYYRKKYAKKAIQTLPLAHLLLAKPVKDASQTSFLVRHTLLQMNQQRRELLMMKYVDKKKVKEIARSWKKTVKSVESELFRARQEFRALYIQVENQQSA